MTQKTIWVIDDDPIYQIIINKIIKKNNYFSTICTYNNGKEALDSIQNSIENQTTSSPDIILLDINMPIMDGWEFLEALEPIKPKLGQKIMIYIVSSSIALEDKNKSNIYPDVLGYLSKPITVDDLIKIAATH